MPRAIKLTQGCFLGDCLTALSQSSDAIKAGRLDFSGASRRDKPEGSCRGDSDSNTAPMTARFPTSIVFCRTTIMRGSVYRWPQSRRKYAQPIRSSLSMTDPRMIAWK